MRIDQLALLIVLVIAANLILLLALELPRLSRRGRLLGTDQSAGLVAAGVSGVGPASTQERDPQAGQRLARGVASSVSAALYQRVVRVISLMFIGAVLVVASVTDGDTGPAIYVMLAVGWFLIVLFQDILPAGFLGRARRTVEAAAAVVFVTVLVQLSGGYDSPYFFGYVLLLGAASLWASGFGPPVMAVLTSAAYILAVYTAAEGVPLTPADVGRVAFNLVALALITYVATVIGREQRRAREEALRLSRIDSLTGLHSRDHFVAEVEQELLRASRSGRPFALVMVDLDGLKAANDRFGHASGDLLLRAVAEVLRGDIRATDVAARFGGDEFVLLLPETDLAGALLVADKVRVDIRRLALPNNGSVIRTSASLGVVTFPDDGRTSSELLRRADLAMYEAKRRGRDQTVRYSRDVSEPVATGGDQPRSPTGTETRAGGAASGPAARQPAAAVPLVPPPTPGRPPWETGRG